MSGVGVVWAGAQEMPSRVFTSAEVLEDARLARRALETIHPGYDRYTNSSELAAAWDAFEANLQPGANERDFFAQLSLVLAKIRCSHTKAEPSQAWQEWRKSQPTYLPFQFEGDGQRMLVGASATDDLKPGDEVIAIDGRSSVEVLARIFAAVPADGFTDRARWFALGGLSDLDDCEFDHFYPFYFPLGDKIRLEIRRLGESSTRSIAVTPQVKAARNDNLKLPAAPRNFDEGVQLDFRNDGVAVLRIGTFVAYRKPIPPVTVLGPLFRKIDEAGTRCLILDLRGNGGGSDDAVETLLRFLSPKPLPSQSRRWVRVSRLGEFDSVVDTWDRSIFGLPEDRFRKLDNGYLEIVEPTKKDKPPIEPGFRGKLIALTGPANASGATLCLASLRERAGAVLVGEPTGGSVEGPTAGVLLFLKLPHTGIRVRIPVVRTITGFKCVPGLGILPDVLVNSTFDDRLDNRDPVLEAALSIARETTDKDPSAADQQ
jgi:C-terminal processing protease CtpA/Prc